MGAPRRIGMVFANRCIIPIGEDMGYKVCQGSLTSSSSMLCWFYKILMVSRCYYPRIDQLNPNIG